MKTKLFFKNLLFTTQLFKMERIYTLLCSFALFILDSWIFKDAGKYSRTTRCFSRIKDKRVLIANSRTILGAQGRLGTLGKPLPCAPWEEHCKRSDEKFIW